MNQPGQDQVSDHSDETSIREILDAQESSWNQGDSISWGNPYREDADFVNIMGHAMQGRAAMVDRHARIFSGAFKGSRVTITIRRFTKLSAEIACIDTLHQVTNFQFLPPGIVPTSPGNLQTMMKYVAHKTGGTWQFVAAQNTAILPGSEKPVGGS